MASFISIPSDNGEPDYDGISHNYITNEVQEQHQFENIPEVGLCLKRLIDNGTRSINDDKTRQDKKWKNENWDTDVIDLTREEDEVEKKEDTHLGKRGRDDDVIILTGEGEVEEKKGTSLKERVRGGRESLVEDRPSSENSSEETDDDDDDDDDFDDLSSSENSSEDSDNRPNDGGNLTGVGEVREPAVVGVSSHFVKLCKQCVKRDKLVQKQVLSSFVGANLDPLLNARLIENTGEEEQKRIIKKIGSNRSDSFAMILSNKGTLVSGAEPAYVEEGQQARLISLEDVEEWKNSEEKLGKKKLGVFNLYKCYQPRAAPSLANCLKSPSKR